MTFLLWIDSLLLEIFFLEVSSRFILTLFKVLAVRSGEGGDSLGKRETMSQPTREPEGTCGLAHPAPPGKRPSSQRRTAAFKNNSKI